MCSPVDGWTLGMNPVQFYKCHADDTRLRCALLIAAEGELCVCELTAALGESQPKTSRHLAQLRECGLLLDRREGKWVFYRLSPSLPTWASAVLAETLGANKDYLRENLRALGRMKSRPGQALRCA